MPKAFGLATKLDALVIVKINDNKKTRYEHFHNESAPYQKFLRIFGEAGTVKLKTKTTPKMLNKGATCMFIGFPENHDGECWLMYNAKTRGVHTTRDVVWLRRMYYQKAIQAPEIVPITEEESSEDGEGEILNSEDDADSASQTDEANQDSENHEDTNPFADAIPEVYHDDSKHEESNDNNEGSQNDDSFQQVTRSGRIVRENSRYLGNEWTSAAIELTTAENNYYSALAEMSCMIIDKMMDLGHGSEVNAVGAALGGGFSNTSELHPMKYEEAMASPDKAKWEKAIKEEYQ
jgi:hypothetical protein